LRSVNRTSVRFDWRGMIVGDRGEMKESGLYILLAEEEGGSISFSDLAGSRQQGCYSLHLFTSSTVTGRRTHEHSCTSSAKAGCIPTCELVLVSSSKSFERIMWPTGYPAVLPLCAERMPLIPPITRSRASADSPDRTYINIISDVIIHELNSGQLWTPGVDKYLLNIAHNFNLEGDPHGQTGTTIRPTPQ
jgi:hypothetical protein